MADPEKTRVKVGDWVRIPQLWPGIWQVYRVLSGFNEDVCSLDDDEPVRTTKRTLVFCHRLLNDPWNRSFSHQCCEISLVVPAATQEKQRLRKLLSSDEKLKAAFAAYKLKQNRIDSIVNIAFGGFTPKEKAGFAARCEQMLAGRIEAGLSLRQIARLLQQHGLYRRKGRLPSQCTLQLTCVNHELRGKDFVFRQWRVLDF